MKFLPVLSEIWEVMEPVVALFVYHKYHRDFNYTMTLGNSHIIARRRQIHDLVENYTFLYAILLGHTCDITVTRLTSDESASANARVHFSLCHAAAAWPRTAMHALEEIWSESKPNNKWMILDIIGRLCLVSKWCHGLRYMHVPEEIWYKSKANNKWMILDIIVIEATFEPHDKAL
ncbi:hypothetical protein BD769DRAFT_1387672 [Suillus cothurnatus]|nr:hypothetical protein BD769DRAFT_1387672 [Suillus cothurnatus]